MKTQPHLDPDDRIGDFDALLRQLEVPCERIVMNAGYSALMARMASADYRRDYTGSKS